MMHAATIWPSHAILRQHSSQYLGLSRKLARIAGKSCENLLEKTSIVIAFVIVIIQLSFSWG